MLKRIVCMECFSYYGIEKYTFDKEERFLSSFIYLQYFLNDSFSRALVIDFSERMLVLFDW